METTEKIIERHARQIRRLESLIVHNGMLSADADNILITDGSGYYTGNSVEDALHELGGENCVVVTSAYVPTKWDRIVVCNSTTAFTVTLPIATGSGKKYSISNVNTGVITVDGNGSETINGELTQLVDRWACLQVVDYSTGLWTII
jgi:hypothetical protein